MSNSDRIGHQIGSNPGDIHFPRGAGQSTLNCTCTAFLDAPTPELLDLEWQAHRREVSDNDTARRVRAKAPGYLAGGRFE